MFEPTFIPVYQVGHVVVFLGPLLAGAQMMPSTHLS